MSERPVRVRIAPSPTGDPHVGTAYVALFNYAFARRRGGKFILRIEDTDRARSTLSSEQAIIRSLRWLGLSWDEGPDVGGDKGPYRQSERGEIYREHAEMLVERGEAYRCFCTAERLSELRAKQREEKARLGYDGHCRELGAEDIAARCKAGEPHVIRLKMPRDGETTLNDGLRGAVTIANAQSDDQVLLKSDGMPTYHLANVVDDHLMGISHVIRAEEWISSAPKHLRLYQAFGWEAPQFIHLPLLRNADKNKSKISKRRNPVSLDYYRDVGIVPQAMINFLALLGWSYGDDQEIFSLEQMIERFDLTPEQISLAGPVFDLEKLSWLNGQYIHNMSDEAWVDGLMAWRFNREYLLKLAPLFRERIQRFDQFVPAASYLFSGDLDYTGVADALKPKKREGRETAKMLEQLTEGLDGHAVWTVEVLEQYFKDFCESSGWKTREVFMPVRMAVCGTKASPPLFETMITIGREISRRRLREAARFLKTLG